MSTLIALPSSTNEKADSTSPNSSARGGATRPDTSGRLAVRPPMRASMSRSSRWLSALAPPEASAPPTSSAASLGRSGTPRAPANMPAAAVSRSRLMMRGLVRVT